jgi:nucleoprotein TPR
MAAATIELPYLSSHYAIAESTLRTLTEAPTVELVNQLLEAITKKAREFDELRSDKLRLEVELENAVRSNESKIKVLKGSVEKAHAELEETRKKLQESGRNCCRFISSDLSSLVQKMSDLASNLKLLRSNPPLPPMNPKSAPSSLA